MIFAQYKSINIIVKGTSKAVISRSSVLISFYSSDRASDLGRVYNKEFLLLPEDQGLLFHHTFGKTLRGKDS